MSSAGKPVWHSAFPQPKGNGQPLAVEDLYALIKDSSKVPGKDYLVIDTRRADFETAFIKGAINLPAHSFYPTLPTIRTLISHVPLLIFHCNSCKPGGRGQRVSGWYLDALGAEGSSDKVEVKYLEGGIKAWIDRYGSDEEVTVQLPPLE